MVIRRELLKYIGGAGLAPLAAGLPGMAHAASFNLTLATGHPPTFVWIGAIRDVFVPEMDRRFAALGHKINWTTAWSGTLTKIGGELDALQKGIADISLVGAIFQPAKLPLQMVNFFAPFSTVNVKNAVEVLDDLYDTIPELHRAWDENGSVYLAGIGTESLQLYSKKLIRTPEELKGLKVSAAGPHLNWLRGTGAAGVMLAPPTIYSDVQNGVYDALFTTPSVAAGIKLHEVAPFMLRCDINATSWAGLAMSKTAWAALPADAQRATKEAALVFRGKLMEQQHRNSTEIPEALSKQKLLTVTNLSEDLRARWANSLPDIATEWASQLESKGVPAKRVMNSYLAGLRKRGEHPLRDWSFKT